MMTQDFLGNELHDGDKVVCVMGKHLRKSVIESITYSGGMTTIEGYRVGHVKIKGLKTVIYSNCIIKTDWK